MVNRNMTVLTVSDQDPSLILVEMDAAAYGRFVTRVDAEKVRQISKGDQG